MQPKQQPQMPKGQYVAHPEVQKLHVDSLGEIKTFENGVVRIEFTNTMWDPPKPPRAPTGKRYTTARIAMNTQTAAELFNFLNRAHRARCGPAGAATSRAL